ncbi:hypothetical protein [Nostoc sp.]|uniref:hypothetical protein n=1 Tax=Nostoc sp. TaxID=1180 RepID=UPI002FF8FDAA
MSDEECREVYRQLVAMLNESQMNWVVEEVNEVVRAGEIIDKPVENSYRRRSLSREFITTREYTSQEALLLLIDAIHSVVVQTAFIEKEVTNFFRGEGEEFNISPDVRFVSEEDSEPRVFTYSSAIDRAQQALILERLIEQLRAELRE